jgi:WD40 repeat protein
MYAISIPARSASDGASKNPSLALRAGRLLVLAGIVIALICPLPSDGQEPEPAKARVDRYGDPLPKGAILRLGTLRFCQPFPSSLVYSPDGKFIASGGSDNRIRLWEPETGKEIRALEGHKGSVNCIALSADGKWLASGSQAHELHLWEVATGKVHRRFLGHTAPIERLALSPNGKVLASSCLGGTLRLWDTDTGKETRSLPIDKGHRVQGMQFTPDSKHLAFNNRSDQGIQLVDVAGGKLIRAFKGHKDNVDELVFTADGKTLLSGGADHTIRAWDVASGKEQRRFGDEKQLVRSLALAPDGKTLTYGTHPDGLVHIWDLSTNKHLVPPWKADPHCIVSIAYSPDSKKVVVARETIAIHETATGKRLNPTTESESHIRQVEYGPDGKRVAVWRWDHTIELWDTNSWQKKATLRPQISQVTSMAFSPRGQYLTTAEGDGGQGFISHWDPKTGKRHKAFPQVQGWLEALSYSADGQTLAWSHIDHLRVPVLWDAMTGKEQRRIIDPDHSDRNPRLSPDGRLLACGSWTHAVALWDTQTGRLVRGFGKRFARLDWIAFSPDGRTIATPGGLAAEPGMPIQRERTIVFWETATGQERMRIATNEGLRIRIAYSPDGRLLAWVDQSETILLCDAWTGKEVGTFTGHRGAVTSLSFAPDGKTLVSGGLDSTVVVWDVSGLLPPARPAAEKLSREELARCWDDLAGTDAVRAYQVMAKLSRHPNQAEGLLKERLAANPGTSAERLARLIADLDSDNFKTREKASLELANLGQLAEGALRNALEGTPSPELKRRVQELLKKLDGKPDNPEHRRLLRAIELLERLGTSEARRLLDKLAKEATDPDTARQAKDSLARLARAGRGAP